MSEGLEKKSVFGHFLRKKINSEVRTHIFHIWPNKVDYFYVRKMKS